MAPEVINVHEAKTQFSRLLDNVRAAQEIVVAKARKPSAKLVPIEPPANAGQRELGFLNGRVDDSFFEPVPEEELAAWEDGPLAAEPIVEDAQER